MTTEKIAVVDATKQIPPGCSCQVDGKPRPIGHRIGLSEWSAYDAEAHSLYHSGIIQWHEGCRGRHGVIRGVADRAALMRVGRMLTYYFGEKCWWQSPRPDGKFNVEFVPMTKVFPPPTRPWEWCGTTVFFGDWHRRETVQRATLLQFRPGNRVAFEARGKTHVGIVANVNRKTVSVAVAGEGTWRVGPNLLRFVGEQEEE